MASVDDVKFAVWQPSLEVLGVAERHNRVSAASDDLHGRLYLRQDISEDLKLSGVRLHIPNRFRESIAFVRRQVVLAGRIGDPVVLERLDHAFDDPNTLQRDCVG